jgi:hypothetical protein
MFYGITGYLSIEPVFLNKIEPVYLISLSLPLSLSINDTILGVSLVNYIFG